MFTASDDDLVRKALKGNKKAWLSLLNRYEKPVFNFALRMTGNHHDSADLMQEIFVSVLNSLPNYRGNGAFKAWLFKIAHFRCMDYFRRQKPNVSLDDCPELAQDIEHGSCEQSPEIDMQFSQSRQQLNSFMQALPVNQRIVVELKFFSQFTFEEIAQQLGISANTVKSRLYAALANLKSAMEVTHV
ncbi:MAG: sigma-70 family RNA polymerase sigma factor [Glaciecola sp.]